MDSAQGDASKEFKEAHIEAVFKEVDEHDLPFLGNMSENENETSSSSSSSSTSSDDSSEEDLFQLDASELNSRLAGNSELLHVQHRDNAQLASEFRVQNGETAVISRFSKHGAANLCENEGMLLVDSQVSLDMPFSPDVYGASPVSDLSTFGARQSPPVQVIARADVPDPNRIPSSIFARSKSSTTMEWSEASNESLFSIHVGNSSFSRDHAILLGKSGELGSTPPLSPLTNSTPPPKVHDVGQGLAQPGVAAAANAEAMKDVLRAAAEGHADKGQPSAEASFPSSSISRRSDGSATSFRSFAFPILTEGRSESVKVEPEVQQKQQPEQPQLPIETPKAAPYATESKWFSCFSCCTFCRSE